MKILTVFTKGKQYKQRIHDSCTIYGVEGVPASYLIAQDGTIVASNEELREFDLDRTLSKFLK